MRKAITISSLFFLALTQAPVMGQVGDLVAIPEPESQDYLPIIMWEESGEWEYRPCKVDMVETFYYNEANGTWTGSITNNQNELGAETIAYDIVDVGGYYERSVTLDGFNDPEGFVDMLDTSTIGLDALVDLEDAMATYGIEVDEFSIEYSIETDTWSTREVIVDNPVNLSNGTTANTYDMMYSFRFLPLLEDSEEVLNDGLREPKVTIEIEVEVKMGPNVKGKAKITFEGTPEEVAEAKELIRALMTDTVDLTMEEVKRLLAQLLEWIKSKQEEFSEKLARWWYNNFLKE